MIQKNQRYRALRDLEVGVLTHYRAPFTGGGRGTLPAGEIFKVAFDPPEHATAASCDPENYAALHERLVDQKDREWHNYSGYSLTINLDIIERECELVESGAVRPNTPLQLPAADLNRARCRARRESR